MDSKIKGSIVIGTLVFNAATQTYEIYIAKDFERDPLSAILNPELPHDYQQRQNSEQISLKVAAMSTTSASVPASITPVLYMGTRTTEGKSGSS